MTYQRFSAPDLARRLLAPIAALLDKFGVTNRVQLAVAVAECAIDDVAR